MPRRSHPVRGVADGRRTPYVYEATLRLADTTEPTAVGAAVTVALCGSADHEGGCRWPHHNGISPERPVATFRTVFVAPWQEESDVLNRIDQALRFSSDWSVVSAGPRALKDEEQPLAVRLAKTPPPLKDEE